MNKINLILKKCGIQPQLRGHDYLHEAIKLVLEDRNNMSVSKILYPRIAKKFNVTASKVERAIRNAIEIAFNNLDPNVIFEIFGNTIPLHKDKPTNSHFIATIAELLRDGENSGGENEDI